MSYIMMIGLLMILASIARGCAGCPFCARQQLQQLQRSQPQPQPQPQQQQQLYRTIGSPRPFGADRPTRIQEFNRTGVLHPEYQIPATIKPGNVSQMTPRMPDLDYGGRGCATPDAATPALCPDANFTIAVSPPDANERSTCGGCSDGGVSTFLATTTTTASAATVTRGS